MQTPPVFFMKILHLLAGRYFMSFTLEELAERIASFSDISKFTGEIATARENQAKLLDALILMDYQGYIFLDEDTDHIVMTIKGLIQINNTIIWN
jgi:hypothetical protein